MADEIRVDYSPASCSSGRLGDTSKPELVNKVEGSAEEINGLLLIPGTDGLLSVSSDRSVRVWLLRDSGQYWPSVCHYMSSAATAIRYIHGDSRRLFVGLESGLISEFVLSDDFNHLEHVRDYHAHQNRVAGLYYSVAREWLLSVARDRYFQYHCKQSGRRLGGYLCNAWCTSVQYDEDSRYVFIGDHSGQITVCRLEESGVTVINTLKGHNGSIQSLIWDRFRGWLYSGSYDSSVSVWDIGGRKGTVYELHGHRNKVNAICYNNSRQVLISASEDQHLVLWRMAEKRLETCEWAESDNCQLCNRPFFWNLRAMYDQKQFGLRQHHCRKCGKAVCDSCSGKRSVLPLRGHEFPVRVCEGCYIGIADHEKKSLADFHDMKHPIRVMDYDEQRAVLATVGPDNVIKIWNMASVL